MTGAYDVAIVGAGAAGLVTAIAAARVGPVKILLLDGREKVGAKILMSGGTRCNITNVKVSLSDFQTETPRTVRNILRSFPPERTKVFFEELGVAFVLEEGGKYFPSTHSGRTVLEALLTAVKSSGVELKTNRKVTWARRDTDVFHLGGEGFEFTARTLILCSGGLSYPATGSDGTGYEIAGSLGHDLIPQTPALTPLLTDDTDWHALSGVTVDCRLELLVSGQKKAEYTGSFLFTHKGFSGPAVLDISRHWLRSREAPGRFLRVSFLPKKNENEFREKLIAESAQNPKKSLKRFLASELPERLAEVLFKKAGMDSGLILNQLSRDSREALIRTLFYCPLQVSGSAGYAKAEVTAGGVDLPGVDAQTLESLKVPGLYFAGEILDVDGRIGGFNFQWSWASAHAAGVAAAKKVLG